MKMEVLVQDIIESRNASKAALDAGDIKLWLNLIPMECCAVDKLRAELIRQPAVIANSPEVLRLLKEIDVQEFSDPDKLGMDIFWGSVSPTEYIAALMLVDVLITPFVIPRELKQFLSEARACYALGHYAAVQSLSRTILETAINDIAVRTEKMPAEAIEKDMFIKYPPKKRICLVSGKLFDVIYEHYRDLCKVVHGLSTNSSLGPLQALKKTIGFVEALYYQNANLIQEKENG